MLKKYVTKVNKTNYGAEYIVSRSNAGIVAKLFENEVPEIQDGTVVVDGQAKIMATKKVD